MIISFIHNMVQMLNEVGLNFLIITSECTGYIATHKMVKSNFFLILQICYQYSFLLMHIMLYACILDYVFFLL